MQASISSTRSITKTTENYYPVVQPIPYHYGRGELSGRRVKLVFDYLLALSTLMMLAPLLLVISLAIKLDSYGPLFYRRRMLGRNGRIFYAYAFRAKTVDGQQRTRVGRFLVQARLVELPLLINILKNEISFVGPRALAPDQIILYGSHADRLLSVMPGITGYWQVNGRQNGMRIEQDMQYIEQYSLVNDLAILLKTVTAVFHIRK